MLRRKIPDIVISRLPIYLRALRHLEEAGQEYTSSQQLGRQLGVGSAQIRKDLAHFGEFGKQGTGYEVKYLQQQISKILNVDRHWSVALIGFGGLGQAIAHYSGFADKGFYIKAIFDNDPEKINSEFKGKMVYDFKRVNEILTTEKIKIAIVAVPALAAQKVTDELIAAGVQAILNYAPITLRVPEGVWVQYIDPIVHLQHISYYLS